MKSLITILFLSFSTQFAMASATKKIILVHKQAKTDKELGQESQAVITAITMIAIVYNVKAYIDGNRMISKEEYGLLMIFGYAFPFLLETHIQNQ